VGAVATLIYSAAVTYVILKLIEWTIGLRVTQEQEEDGLDLSVHGEHVG
jgi:Amt family ammonium transporter